MKNSIQPYYGIALAANQVFTLPAYGRMLNILGVTGANYVSVALPGQTFARLKSQLSYELPDFGTFNTIQLRNDEGVSITVDVVISDGRVLNNDAAGVVAGLSDVLAELVGTNQAETVIPQKTVTGTAAKILDAGSAKRDIYLQQKYPGGGAYVFLGDASLSLTNWAVQLSPIGSTKIPAWTGEMWAMTSTGTEWLGGRIA